MVKKITEKVIAIILVTIMLLAYASTIGINARRVYALENSIEVQGVKTNNENVEFDAYFVNGNSKVHETENKIGGENSIYLSVNVKNAGYLQNAKIHFLGKDNNSKANFTIKDLAQENNVVTKINTQQNIVELNQINKNEQANIQIPISFNSQDKISLEEFSKESKAYFTAKYIDENGSEKQISSEIVIKINWTNDVEVALEQQVTKYVPYTFNGKAEVMLQTVIKSSIKDNNLPVKEENIEIKVPLLAETKPTSVKVAANSTKATNGDQNGINFTKENYTYDEEQGKIEIKVENKIDENNNVSWMKNTQDEFIVTYIYPQTILDNMPEEGNKITLEANANIIAYGTSELLLNKNIIAEGMIKDTIGSIVDLSLTTNTEQLSKGYIYANYDTEDKIETEYKENVFVNIANVDLTDNIVVLSNTDNLVKDEKTKGSTTYGNTNFAYVKELKIEKEVYDKFIGEEGYINLYKNEVLINTINKETLKEDVFDEEGNIVEGNKYVSIDGNNIVVDLKDYDVNELVIQTSKPLIEGNLKFEITKALKGNIGYNKNQMKEFIGLEVISSVKGINNSVEFDNKQANKIINLVDPKTEAELLINTQNLSTVITNKDVEIRAILKTNSLEYNLYKNPTIAITMPSYVENMNIKDAQLLFNDELQIKSANLIENANREKVIVIELQGTQTKYDIGNIAGGINIVILADIDLNNLTPNTQAEIRMNYTNENVIQPNSLRVEENQTSALVNIVAPIGVVTQNSISGYRDGEETLTSINAQEETAVIDIMSPAREVTYNMSVMNNYNNTIEDVTILGRFPAEGNRSILNSEDLGSNMDLDVTSPITVNGIDESNVTVYYSENANATQDLTLAENNWTTTPETLDNVRSYLIDTNDYVMNTADSITFNYNAVIPENLQHNLSSNETYAVFFTNNLQEGAIQDSQETATLRATTGQGPVLEASITSNVDEDEVVLSGNLIKYTVTVKNTGDLDAENVLVRINRSKDYLKQVEIIDEEKLTYKEIDETYLSLGNIKVGETCTKDIWFFVNRIENVEEICNDDNHYLQYPRDYKLELSLIANITADNLEREVTTQSIKTKIKNAFFKFDSRVNLFDGIEDLNEGQDIIYTINIFSFEETENTTLKIKIPNQLEFEKVTQNPDDEEDINSDDNVLEVYNNVTDDEDDEEDEEDEEVTNEIEVDSSKINYDKNNNILEISISGKKEDVTSLNIYLKVKQIEEKVFDEKISLRASVRANNIDEEFSNIVKLNIVKNDLKIIQTSNIPEGIVIDNDEEFQYIINIESIGKVSNKNLYINLLDKLPKEIAFIKAIEKAENGIEKNLVVYKNEDNSLKTVISVKEGTKKDIILFVKPKIQVEDVEVENKIEASIEDSNKINVNSIKHILKATEIDDYVKEGEITRRISGQVWIDTNKDGIKDEDETKVKDIEVMLYNNEEDKLQTDSNGEILKEKTSEDGIYTFTQIPQGKYTVIFLYDTANYSSTAYKKQGVDEIRNSDALDTQITLDGKKQIAAITDEIELSNSNIYNVDLGLVLNPKFDLRLDKTVSKITVQDNTGTKTYNYEDTKLAKRDLVGKQIDSTTIVVEYKMKVTNEGAVPGYVKKIADYIPSDLKFNSELNRDWYQGENGTLFNASLSNTLINPGETKEVTLLLTKKLTSENIGLIQNNAEIYEAYNDLGLPDADSIEANKVTDEDDYSSADILLTVKTGKTIAVILISLAIISTITVGAYVIKRKILD